MPHRQALQAHPHQHHFTAKPLHAKPHSHPVATTTASSRMPTPPSPHPPSPSQQFCACPPHSDTSQPTASSRIPHRIARWARPCASPTRNPARGPSCMHPTDTALHLHPPCPIGKTLRLRNARSRAGAPRAYPPAPPTHLARRATTLRVRRAQSHTGGAVRPQTSTAHLPCPMGKIRSSATRNSAREASCAHPASAACMPRLSTRPRSPAHPSRPRTFPAAVLPRRPTYRRPRPHHRPTLVLSHGQDVCHLPIRPCPSSPPLTQRPLARGTYPPGKPIHRRSLAHRAPHIVRPTSSTSLTVLKGLNCGDPLLHAGGRGGQ